MLLFSQKTLEPSESIYSVFGMSSSSDREHQNKGSFSPDYHITMYLHPKGQGPFETIITLSFQQ